MPSSPAPVGIYCKTFINRAGSASVPVWNVLSDIGDESLSVTYDEANFDRRGAPTGESEPTIRRCELTLKILKDPTNADYAAMRSAFLARTSIDIMALDSAAVFANGTIDLANTSANITGVRYTGKLFGFNEGRNLNDAVFNETTVKPAFNSGFKTVSISGGALVYTAPTAA